MARPRRKPTVLPSRKPMAVARRVSLFEREVRVGLSSAAVEILFDCAAVLSEGQLDGDHYEGSTMVTIDLTRAAGAVSDACDIATARKVADLVACDGRVRARARRLGLAEAEKLANARLADPQIDVRVRRSGRHLHLDMDVEAPVKR